jgi:hypothetical protein
MLTLSVLDSEQQILCVMSLSLFVRDNQRNYSSLVPEKKNYRQYLLCFSVNLLPSSVRLLYLSLVLG